MLNLRPLLLAVLPLFALSGCLTSTGAMIAPTSPGVSALNGGVIGRSPEAASLSASAKSRAIEAEYQALQFGAAGEPVAWSADGASGQVVPTQVYRVGSQDCRAYTQIVTAPAGLRLSGTACRDAAGLWVPVV